MALNKNDVTIKVSLDGKDVEKDAAAISKSLKDIAEAANSASGKKAFSGVADNANAATKAIGLTRQEALALTYTFNDITASLASGSSPFTILFQQGGQLTQAFGGVTNTFKALLPYVLRLGPAIAAAAAAGGAFYGLKIGADAAESLAKLSDQADKAKLSVQSLQKLVAAGAASGVPADEVAGGLKRVADEALKAATAQSELSNKIQEASRKAAFGVAGAAQELAKLKAQQPDNIFAKLGVSLSGFTGRVDDSLPAIKRLADRLASLPAGLRRDQLIGLAEATFGEGLTKVLLKGSRGIEAYSAKLDALVPKLEPAAIEAAKSARELLGVYDEAQKRANDQAGALFLPALVNFRQLLLNTFNSSKPILKAFAAELDVFFNVLAGKNNKAAQSPVTAGIAEGLVATASTLKTALGVATDAARLFYAEIDKSVQSVNALLGLDLKTWAVVAGGAIALIFGPVGLLIDGIALLIAYWPQVSQAATAAAQAISAAWSGLTFDGVWEGLKAGAAEAFTWIYDQAVGIFQAIKDAGATFFSSIGNAFSQAGASIGSALGFASGGYVAGPGTGTSDSIPAWLSNGEFVVRSAAVKRFGVDFFRQLNGLSLNPSAFGGRFGFAAGGLVGAPSGLSMAGGTGGRSFNLVIDGRSFNGLSGQSDTIASLEKYASLRQLSATSKRAPSRIG